ncbi:MAG: glycine reductase [Pseudomonadota bacterium]
MSEPLPYIVRIRDYYLALGYAEPYRWARFDDVPFTPFRVPIEEATIAVVTTAAPFKSGAGEQGPGAPYNGRAKFFEVYSGESDVEPDLRISHIAIDRDHTSADDQGSYFPLRAFQTLVADGELGALAHRFHGLPTDRSQRNTLEKYAPEIVRRCRQDEADGVVLVPNCPVCHQSVSLVARVLEESGIPTVILGCARDIVEYVGVPRLLFNDFPLGNAAGRPHDPDSQTQVAREALALLADADQARTTRQSSLRWSDDDRWKRDYSNAALLSREEIARRREEFDRAKRDAKAV